MHCTLDELLTETDEGWNPMSFVFTVAILVLVIGGSLELLSNLVYRGQAAFLIVGSTIELGGFSAAARACGMTPSAVSKLVARLEQRLGTRLVNRSTRQLQLTPEGCTFHERGVRILAGLGLARLAAFQVCDDIAAGRLATVLEDCNPGDLEEVHAVYVGQGGYLPLRVRACLDFLAEKVDIGQVAPVLDRRRGTSASAMQAK